jgi:hypothetical protein
MDGIFRLWDLRPLLAPAPPTRTTPLLFRWARRAGAQDADAADLVQEVLALLVHKLPTFEYDS